MIQTLFDATPVLSPAVGSAVDHMRQSGVEERGAVFTKRAVVDFMLDLADYTPDRDLAAARLLEPSAGEGEFVQAAVERLLVSYFERGGCAEEAGTSLSEAIRAVELHQGSHQKARSRIGAQLAERGIAEDIIEQLLGQWFVCGDYLLTPLPAHFTHVLGNPPYVRQELIPDVLLEEYRRRYETIYDRADLYIPFIEKSLTLLATGGVLAFICSDRWMKNRYGGPLRAMVTQGFHLRYYVDMVDTPAFEGEVMAYPAIFVIGREAPEATRMARRPLIEPKTLESLAAALAGGDSPDSQVEEADVALAVGSAPWVLEDATAVRLLRRLEGAYPTLESTGCRVGIGVATGVDKVFIQPMEALDVEESRRLPIVMASDIQSGFLKWSGKAVLNPFRPEGGLVDLTDYPRFAAFLHSHEAQIRGRHVAKKNPDSWYKTIDRIWPELTTTPKLLIPDIKGAANVVYDEGAFYPHHNLYYVVSSRWDLRALQALLRSSVAEFFVAMYCVKMKGGFLRFQAQYIRRIRLPRWEEVSPNMRQRLRAAAEAPRECCDEIAYALFGLSKAEQAAVQSIVYEAEHLA